MKKRLVVVLSFIIAIVLASCGTLTDKSSDEQQGGPVSKSTLSEKVTIRVSHCDPTTVPQHLGFEMFKKIVEEESGGAIQVKIYPATQLGGERESLEQVKNGSLEMATASAGPVTTFNKQFMLLDIPFVFDDYETAWMVMDGPVGQSLLRSGENVGLKGLGFMENGFRHVTNNVRPIKNPVDFKGLKIRTMEAPMHMENFKALGANPTPVPWQDTFLALQQNVVDGQENPLAAMYAANMFEVQRFLSLTGHIYDPMTVFVNPKWFYSLSEEHQALIHRAIILGQNYSRFVNKQREDFLVEEFETKGVQVNYLTIEEKEQLKSTSQKAVIEQVKKAIDQERIDAWLEAIEQVRKDVTNI